QSPREWSESAISGIWHSQDATKQVLQALRAGFRHVDAAQMYANEESVGNAIEAFLSTPNDSQPSRIPSREDIYVTTKFHRTSSGSRTVKDVLKGQLRALKVEYVDLYLLHTLTPFVGQLGSLWEEFEGVKAEGLAKEIGVSNFRVGDFEELLASINARGEFHPYVLKAALPILDIHARYGIQLASYGGQTPVSRKRDGPVTPVLQAITKRMNEERSAIRQASSERSTKNVLKVGSSSRVSRGVKYPVVE
ncbi:related to oxidoreductase, aldo/keto reductase family, partial [Serendipita indica DSM 11827]